VRIEAVGKMLHMGKKHRKADKPGAKERKSDIREAITAADATGLIAGEELITEAETLLPLSPQRPQASNDLD
jgi:hypothetical protein